MKAKLSSLCRNFVTRSSMCIHVYVYRLMFKYM